MILTQNQARKQGMKTAFFPHKGILKGGEAVEEEEEKEGGGEEEDEKNKKQE